MSIWSFQLVTAHYDDVIGTLSEFFVVNIARAPKRSSFQPTKAPARIVASDWPESLVPMSKCVFQGAIQHVNTNIEETLDSVPVPSHLLLLHHSFGDNLVGCRLDEPGRDPLYRTVTLSIIGHRICFHSR
jgi:hypothetical protein